MYISLPSSSSSLRGLHSRVKADDYLRGLLYWRFCHSYCYQESNTKSRPLRVARSTNFLESMSSTPLTPSSPDAIKSPSSSPPSSPPSANISDDEYDPRVEKMQKEEEKLKEETKQERKKTKEAEKQRLEEEEDSQSMTDLDWFLSRSQVCTPSTAQFWCHDLFS